MKRWLLVSLLAAALALLPTAAAADENGEGGPSHQFGPYSSTSGDSGTCGPDWANDTFKRKFFVQQTSATTWRVTEAFFDGRFITLAGASPGKCQTSNPHGTAILPGKTGNFGGFLSGTVSGGSYNPYGCDVAAPCNTTSGFILAVFGPTAH